MSEDEGRRVRFWRQGFAIEHHPRALLQEEAAAAIRRETRPQIVGVTPQLHVGVSECWRKRLSFQPGTLFLKKSRRGVMLLLVKSPMYAFDSPQFFLRIRAAEGRRSVRARMASTGALGGL